MDGVEIFGWWWLILRISNRPRLSRHHSSFYDLGASEFSSTYLDIASFTNAMAHHLPLPARNIPHLLHPFPQSYLSSFSTLRTAFYGQGPRHNSEGVLFCSWNLAAGVCYSKPKSALHGVYIYYVYLFVFYKRKKNNIPLYSALPFFPSYYLRYT